MRKKTKALPRESQMSKSDKENDAGKRARQRMFDAGFRAGERSGRFQSGSGVQLRDAKKEIKELKRKVDKLHSTIGFLLTQ